MKGSNSRFSHRPGQRYSNVAHVMGGMVTDADLTETGQIHQRRGEMVSQATVNCGVPANGGAVAIENHRPSLQIGTIFADGKQGFLDSASGNEPDDALSLFEDQADLPLGPVLPDEAVLLYADLWERPVFAFEDDYLTDAGLHSSETSYRTRTMTQVKALPVKSEEDAVNALVEMKEHSGAFGKTGNVLAVLKPKDKDIAVDDCDPCADQISVEQTLPNALFRFEVVNVKADKAGVAEKIQCAWSLENAEAVAKAEITSDDSAREAFAVGKSAYEYFSQSTDAQIGIFHGDHVAERPVFTDNLTEIPNPPDDASEKQAFTHIRRWDGVATATIASSGISDEIGAGSLSFKNNKLQLVTDYFTLELTITGKRFITGDYWLVEVRRYAKEADRLYLVGVRNGRALPVGIRHSYCPLFLVENQTPAALSDKVERWLSFPALSDMPATHVSFDNDCQHIFKHAENVQEALDTLCDLTASQIKFENNCAHIFGDSDDVQEALDELCDLSADQIGFTPPDNCERFAGTNTVAEALGKLCKIEDNSSLTRVLCTMMDWGVVCGLRLTLDKGDQSLIHWTAGTILDRAGRLIEIPNGNMSLNELTPEEIHGDLIEIQKRNGEVCLSVAVDETGVLTLHLSDRDTAFGPGNLTFQETVELCIKGKKGLKFGDRFRVFKDDETKVLGDMVNVWRNRNVLNGHVPMSSNEMVIAKGINEALLETFAVDAPEAAERVKKVWSSLDAELDPDRVSGEARATRRMQLETTKMAALANEQEDHRRACLCENALTPCPTKPKKGPHLVPVGCLELETFDPGNLFVQAFCELCCRKQSMNWRSYRYYFGDRLQDALDALSEQCCGSRDVPPTGDVTDWVGDISDVWERPDIVFPKIPEKDPDLPPLEIWPPVRVPDDYYLKPGKLGPQIDPGRFTGVDESLLNYKPNVDHLGIQEAEDLLTGNGYDVVETATIDGANPLDIMAKYSADGKAAPLITRNPQPGDKVVLLADDGIAVDYLVVEEGEGLLPYTQKSELIKIDAKVNAAIEKIDFSKVLKDKEEGSISREELASVEAKLAETNKLAKEIKTATTPDKIEARVNEAVAELGVESIVEAEVEAKLASAGAPSGIPTAELDAFEAKLTEMVAIKASMETDIATLSEERNVVERDLQDLSRVASRLVADHRETALALDASRAELTEMEELKTSTLESIGAAKREFEDAKRNQETFVKDMRRSQPIEAVVADKRVIDGLKAKGVVTVAELSKMNTNTLKAVLRNTGLQAAEIKSNADSFINR
ncbi:MAG: hypothetical protein GY952_07475 [Rhodobacteraceae bacterium]|nr:hypothetical protein [Paracoccaceae bacterium]